MRVQAFSTPSGDWELVVVYNGVDEPILLEGHTVQRQDLLEALGIKFDRYEVQTKTDDDFLDEGADDTGWNDPTSNNWIWNGRDVPPLDRCERM